MQTASGTNSKTPLIEPTLNLLTSTKVLELFIKFISHSQQVKPELNTLDQIT